MPHLDKLQRDLRGRGLIVLTVARDEDRQELLSFAAQHPYAMRGAYQPDSQSFLHGVATTPFTLLIDRAGVVRGSVLGSASYEQFRRLAEPFL